MTGVGVGLIIFPRGSVTTLSPSPEKAWRKVWLCHGCQGSFIVQSHMMCAYGFQAVHRNRKKGIACMPLLDIASHGIHSVDAAIISNMRPWILSAGGLSLRTLRNNDQTISGNPKQINQPFGMDWLVGNLSRNGTSMSRRFVASHRDCNALPPV